MQELRWILVGLGVAFLLGLWIWETRRPRQASAKSRQRAGERFEPTLKNLESSRTQPLAAPQDEDDEKAALERLRRQAEDAQKAKEAQELPVLEAVQSTLDETAADVMQAERTTSIEAWPKEQKIVTLRVAAPPLERFEGQALVDALQAEQLVHGRYEIFHRELDGRPLFSAASLVEPGTFDLATVAGKRYPGVTLFAVLPGPLTPMQTFDTLLETARSLADRLHGLVQDERGAGLSAQRLMNIREGLIDYQHRLERLAAAGQR
jgi:cell division protein ZipA